MTSRQMIWVVEYHDWDEGWTPQGSFSTKENAEAYVQEMLKDDVRKYIHTDLRIEWEYLDPEYV